MTNPLSPARTRVAPSPTGDPHVGTAFMALFDLAWARKTGGAFVLRIEDTDRNRLVEGSEQQIYDSLEWLGLSPDEGPIQGGEQGPYRQSERLDTYAPYVQQLLDSGHAYHCWCSSGRLAELRAQQQQSKQADTGYDRLCLGKTREERAALPGFSETPVVRMLIPDDAPTSFTDIIRGTVKAPRPDDQVILKTDGFPTYHLAVVVDDHLMGINTVVRGEEWISSTPKHLLLHEWLGFDLPDFAHMPLLRNLDKSKISKRKNPAARLLWFREQGYLPEALRNFLQLLGYAGDEESEVSTFEEFVEDFSWSKVNTVGPIFDLKKLDWLNGHYIRSLDPDELAARIAAHATENGQWESPTQHELEVLRRAVPIIQERLVLLKDALPQLDYLFVADGALSVDADAVDGLAENAGAVLDAAIAVCEAVPFRTEAIQAGLRERIVEGMGVKPKLAFAPIRVAVSGRKVSPPLFESMEILGRDSTLERLRSLRSQL
ncbi:glutamate--tRNA ligase [Tessaracoccus sp. OS52]|uniref:glutamate--tRNA ligase n=1 Tax=Tessaracoccus sp. OS52 TaxID=2886691 RepID=UPI001D1052BF|nr:glutamate--tRNA ligase [Tessaracoccus sp. OS52]MCC2592192.1 glutamate--tRNA ligase [Tessaracoccus sp. OS52]